jgi:hypothetical protein
MIPLSILGVGLGAVAQLVALLTTSKFAFANGTVIDSTEMRSGGTTVARHGSDAPSAGEPAWATLMRGM